MSKGIKTIIYPVSDFDKAKTLFSALAGRAPDYDQPYYAGWNIEGQDLGLDPNGHKQGMTGPVGYWEVDDIKASLQALLEAGAETVQEVRDVGGGKLIATVKDADGNVVGLSQTPA
ncbi:VOC family protein [Nonomuraea sediminis]|uniref:VOC family protein n=1 Tax=Nonomuraea sediminis TaxID=2835864 RepID=UPI001BDC9D7C|nr:VOC family protein [Nonomuraea sediminis]